MELLERTYAYKRAVATNKPLKGTLPILQHLNLMRFFETVVGPELVARLKPYPDMIQYCLDQVGIAASQALVIGDTENDILAARRAGVMSCLACWGYSSMQNELKEQADYAIGHPDEVCEILIRRSNVKRL